MKVKLYLIVLLLQNVSFVKAQGTVRISFQPKIFNETLELDRKYNVGGEELIITNFKFYITGLSFYENDLLVAVLPDKAFLIDIADSASLTIATILPGDFNVVKFNVGVGV